MNELRFVGLIVETLGGRSINAAQMLFIFYSYGLYLYFYIYVYIYIYNYIYTCTVARSS